MSKVCNNYCGFYYFCALQTAKIKNKNIKKPANKGFVQVL